MGSETKACSKWLSTGSRRPARAATCELWPATKMAVRPALIRPRVVSTPVDPIAVPQEARDLALFDDVHAQPVGRAGVAPGNRVVAHRAGATLQQAAEDRKSRIRRVVEERHHARDIRARSGAPHRSRSDA